MSHLSKLLILSQSGELTFSARPAGTFSVLAFFLPFLASRHSAATLTLPVVLASLKLLVMSSLIALAVALPLFTVNNPCLARTSPGNYLGGRLGTLTDLSLLRLLNSLDPAPESPTRDAAIQLLQTGTFKRALPQTIGPVSSARIRLIVTLVLIGLLSLVGGLWVVTRTYAKIAARQRKFEKDECRGMEMIAIAAKDAPGWVGLSEDQLRKMLGTAEEGAELRVSGVFAIP
jgi:hypothetical protein